MSSANAHREQSRPLGLVTALAAAPPTVQISDAGVWVAAEIDFAVSIYVDGNRIWSVLPPRDGVGHRRTGWLMAWPAPLLPYLSGEAEFVVRGIDDSTELYRDVVRLGRSHRPIRLRSERGLPVAVDKSGNLSHMFESTDPARRRAVAQAIGQALATMDELGVPSFVAFGALLGAVRDGELIAHDNDADIVYVARSSHPFDITLEAFELQRAFAARGWRTQAHPGIGFKLVVAVPGGHFVGLDIFTGFYRDGDFFLLPTVRAAVPRSDLLPSSIVSLEGVPLAAPAEPEALLEATYGPRWRTPDPSFKYKPPTLTKRPLAGWFRGARRHMGYWEGFYSARATSVSDEPSAFARWVAGREGDRGAELIDIGCGTGRDSLWFAAEGFTTLGLDYSREAVDFAAQHAKKRSVIAEFDTLNLYDMRAVLVQSALVARQRETDIVYARFLVHAMEDAGRRNLWRFSRAALRKRRGRLYLEFRTEATKHEFGEHFRQFVQPDVIVEELESYGFAIDHCENRTGLAVHNDEDPRVCRIAAAMR